MASIKNPQGSHTGSRAAGSPGMAGWGRSHAPEGKNVGVPDHQYGFKLHRKFKPMPGIDYRGKGYSEGKT